MRVNVTWGCSVTPWSACCSLHQGIPCLVPEQTQRLGKGEIGELIHTVRMGFFSISICGALGNAKFKCQFHISHMGSYVLKSAAAWLTQKQGHEIPSVSYSPTFFKYYRHFFSSIKPWQGLFDQNCQPLHGKTDKGWNSNLQEKIRAQKILEHRK